MFLAGFRERKKRHVVGLRKKEEKRNPSTLGKKKRYCTRDY